MSELRPHPSLQELNEALKIGRLREFKRIWTLINLDMMIPREVKLRIRDLLFGPESDEPIL